MTRVGIALLGLLLSATGCDLILDPPETLQADIQLQMVPDESLRAVLGQADRVFLEFRRGETATDTVVPIYFDGSAIRARLRIAPPPGDDDVRVVAELRRVDEALFRGETFLSPGGAWTASVVLTGVADRIVAPPGQPFTGLGQTLELWSEIYFASGALWDGVEATWSSENPDIVSVDPGNQARPVANGSATLVASFQEVERRIAISVQQVPSTLWELSPSSVALQVGDTVRLTVFGEDVSGAPLLPGAALTWSARTGAASVDNQGLVTAVSAGVDTVVVQNGGLSVQAVVTVDDSSE